MSKPFSAACERNRAPILNHLRVLFADCKSVLEIGSGTGQHAVYFGAQLPQLLWQTSDVPAHHAGIQAWLDEARLPNVLPPLTLDVATDDWPTGPFDAVFTANTCHIMAWPQVEAMVAGASRVLAPGGLFCIYGPLKEGGHFSSDSNAAFDAQLRAQAPHMGIRDLEALERLAAAGQMRRVADHAMPANNRLLAWQRA
jgi:SAM-dependent methyltransferase